MTEKSFDFYERQLDNFKKSYCCWLCERDGTDVGLAACLTAKLCLRHRNLFDEHIYLNEYNLNLWNRIKSHEYHAANADISYEERFDELSTSTALINELREIIKKWLNDNIVIEY